MWVRLRGLMTEKTKEAENQIKAILATNAPNDKVDNNINKIFEDQALVLVKESAQYVLLKMKIAFDRHFKYDHGRPLVLTKNDDVQGKQAKMFYVFSNFCHLVDPNNTSIKNSPLNQI